MNGAIIQGLQRLADDSESFRSRNRGGAFTTEHLVVFTAGSDTAGFESSDAVRERMETSSAEVTIIGLATPEMNADAWQTVSNEVIIAPEPSTLRRDFQAIAARIVVDGSACL